MISNVSEVHLRDPWTSDHPLRESCDEFLTLFSDFYMESLAEMGFSHESANPAFLSDEEFESVFQSIADKLAANSEAVRLMGELRINFSIDSLEMDDLSHLAGIAHRPADNFASL